MFPDNEWIWVAFRSCSITRDWIDGIPQRIKISEIRAYGGIHQISIDDMPFLTKCILMLDDEYTNSVIREQQKEARRNEKKHKRSAARRGR